MSKGKFSARRSISVKALTLMLALVLVVGCVVGGTLAWLVDSTTEVKNTFTTADIEIELIETKKPDGTETTGSDGKVQPVTDWSAQLIPGYTYSKNPKVTVKANSVDCYLFVEFTEPSSTESVLEYTSNLSAENSGWTQGTGDDGDGVPTNVWYRKVTSSTSDQSWSLLANDQVKVSENLTKTNMPAASLELKYKAYASQFYKNNNATDNEFTAAEAWKNVAPPTAD